MKAKALFVAVVGWGCCAGAMAQESHCTAAERVAFTCSVGPKLVSLCASTNLSPIAGYLQYRFGAKGSVELSYPTPPTAAQKHFVHGRLMYSGGGGVYVKFASGDFQYFVYSAGGRDWEKSGVAVERAGKLVRSLVCRGAAAPGGNWRHIDDAKLPDDSGDFEVPL